MSYLRLATRLSAAEGVEPAFVCTQASMIIKLPGKIEMPGAGVAARRERRLCRRARRGPQPAGLKVEHTERSRWL